MRFGPSTLPLIILIAVALVPASDSRAADNLLLNPDFAAGNDSKPADWGTQSWIEMPTTEYIWIRPSGNEPGTVAIVSSYENQARWIQPLHLDPGWYYVGAQVRTIGVGSSSFQTGAMIALTDVGALSDELNGTSDWQNLFFYLKVGRAGADVQVALQLGYLGGFNTGQALFRGASVVPIGAPPADAPAIDLDVVRAHFGGNPWSLLPLLAATLIGIATGWIIYRRAETASRSA